MDALVAIVLFGGVVWVFILAKGAGKPARKSDRFKPRKVNQPLSNITQRPPAPISQAQNLPPMPAGLTLTGKAYVIDGDTIRIKKTKIRLAGIDAPELNMPWLG